MDINIFLGTGGLLIGIIGIITPLIFKKKKKLKQRKDDGLYYDGHDTAHPYCPYCYENKRKNILLNKKTYKCPKCKAVFARPAVAISVCPYPGPRFRI